MPGESQESMPGDYSNFELLLDLDNDPELIVAGRQKGQEQ